LESRDDAETEEAIISSIWTRLLRWYFKTGEGYGVTQQVLSNNQLGETSSESPQIGSAVALQQTYRLRWEGVPLRKWICFVHCSDIDSTSFSEAQKEQAADISRRSGKEGAKFTNTNGGYVWGIVALGKKARFYEYRHVGGGKFESTDLTVGDGEDGGEAIGMADIVEDAKKVHEALVRIKKKSASKGL
jgi:hypothetical protein